VWDLAAPLTWQEGEELQAIGSAVIGPKIIRGGGGEVSEEHRYQ